MSSKQVPAEGTPRSRQASPIATRVAAYGIAALVVGGSVAFALRGRALDPARAATATSPKGASSSQEPADDEPFPMAEETEQIHQTDVVSKRPTVKDAELADHNETDNDLPCEESIGEGGVSDAPFEGAASNGLIGLGGGAGGARFGRGVGGAAPVVPLRLDLGEGMGTESYKDAGETGFSLAATSPLSTFSLDVDTAAYSNVRRMLRAGGLPPAGAVRVEELVNYFPYAYAPPTDGRPLAVHGEVTGCPWAPTHRLVRIGLKARELPRGGRPASNLVFLLDVSGSMGSPEKLPLVQATMRMLLDELSARDSVAIVVYAGASGVALRPTSCERKDDIARAISELRAGGSTAGASGLVLAYEVAAERFVAGGVNRVVLCTDGDWNVGVTSHDELEKLIVAKAKSGVYLTVLGYGMGNYKDDTLELLADKGNGGYGYVDTTKEAHKILVEEADATLVTVAKDVKVQVEWNPEVVAAYRLVGYENRRLAAKDFRDDTKDAGEIGAGHAMTALYEVVPAGVAVPSDAEGTVEPLRYRKVAAPAAETTGSRETCTVKLRWKDPAATESVGLEVALTDAGGAFAAASEDLRFACAVAEFGMLLRASDRKGTATWDSALAVAKESVGADARGYRHELVELVEAARARAR